MTGAASRPLAGIRVLDLTNVIAGPLATYYLAMLGAEVLKVETPGSGDLSRKMGADLELGHRYMGTSFLAMNAGKRSMTLNLKTADGQDILRRLVRESDVLVENFKPGTMDRFGLGWDALRQENPRLIYCAVSGFGQTGPYAGRPSYDQIIQGVCGLMSLTGEAEGSPMRAGFVVCDTSAAITAAFAVAAALVGRGRNDGAVYLDVSMLDTALSTMASWLVSNTLNAGKPPARMGNDSHSAAPSGTFRTRDGVINIVNNEQAQFERLCAVLDLRWLLQDDRFAKRNDRLVHREALREILEQRLSGEDSAHWDRVLAAAGVPVGMVLTVPEAVAQPQVAARGLLQRFADVPGVGRDVTVAGLGFTVDGQPATADHPPPQLGQNTEEVLHGLGLDAEAVARLHREGVI